MKIIKQGLAKGKQKEAIVNFNKGAFKGASTILENLVANDDTNVTNLKLLSCCLFIEEKMREARSYLEEAQEKALLDAEITNLMALTYLKEGNVQKAISVILDAQELQNAPLLNKTLEQIKALKEPEHAKMLPFLSMIQITVPRAGLMSFIPDWVKKHGGLVVPALVVALLAFFYPDMRNIVTGLDIRNRSKISPATQVSIQGIDAIVDARENFRIVLDEDVIKRKFEELKNALSEEHYNKARILVNELLASNASMAVKERVTILESFIMGENSDNIDYIPKYAEIAVAPSIYEGVMLRWSGTVANINHQGRKKTTFDLLVNFLGQGVVEGMALVEVEGFHELNNGDKISVIGPVVGITEDNRVIMRGDRILE